MDFQLEGTRRIVNLLTFMLRSLKAERCDFGGKNRSGAGTLSKQGFLPCPSIIWNSQRRTQIHSKTVGYTNRLCGLPVFQHRLRHLQLLQNVSMIVYLSLSIGDFCAQAYGCECFNITPYYPRCTPWFGWRTETLRILSSISFNLLSSNISDEQVFTCMSNLSIVGTVEPS